MVTTVFFICAALAIAGALGVVSFRNPVHSALAMLGTMVSIAVIYLLHNAEFIFAIQLMIYAGGVMMLVIFVIFLLDLRREEEQRAKLKSGKVIAIGVGGLVFLSLLIPLAGSITGKTGGMTEKALERIGSVEYLSNELFTNYLLPFELASVLLLVGLVGAVALAKKRL